MHLFISGNYPQDASIIPIAVVNDEGWTGELWEYENFADLVDQGVDKYKQQVLI